MKRLLIVLPLLPAIVFLALSVQSWDIRANEYFGDGTMVALPALQSDRMFVGVIDAWGLYVVYGAPDDCQIVPVYSPVGDAQSVECGMVFNDKQTVFRGWMDFRGHARPFCGTRNGDYPQKCFGE